MEGHCCEFLKYNIHPGDFLYIEEEDKEMDLKEEIEELKNKISELEKKIKKKLYKPIYSEQYYYVNLDKMAVGYTEWLGDFDDNTRYAHRVIFETENEAEEYLEYLVKKEEHMNTFTDEEWKELGMTKYYYYYRYNCKEIDYSCQTTNNKEDIIYFRAEEDIRDFIDKYEWQIKHELGVE